MEETRKVVVQSSAAVDVRRSRMTTKPVSRAMTLSVVWNQVRVRMTGSQELTIWSMTHP
jgi:hypothetical protein